MGNSGFWTSTLSFFRFQGRYAIKRQDAFRKVLFMWLNCVGIYIHIYIDIYIYIYIYKRIEPRMVRSSWVTEICRQNITLCYYCTHVTYGLYWHVGGLVQDCSNFSALAMELLQSCAKPSIYIWIHKTTKWVTHFHPALCDCCLMLSHMFNHWVNQAEIVFAISYLYIKYQAIFSKKLCKWVTSKIVAEDIQVHIICS